MKSIKHFFLDVERKIERICRKTGNAKKLLAILKRRTDVNVNHISFDGYSPLHLACLADHAAVVECLIFHGNANPKARSRDKGMTPLHLSCSSGSILSARVLVEKAGVSIDDMNLDGYTALHYAAWTGMTEIVKYLMSIGADPRQKTTEGYTALVLAARCDRLETVAYLLDQMAVVTEYIDEVDTHGCTALHHACWEGHREIVKCLLRAGASTDTADLRGRRASDLSKSRDIREMVLSVTASKNNFSNSSAGAGGKHHHGHGHHDSTMLSSASPPPAPRSQGRVPTYAQVLSARSSNVFRGGVRRQARPLSSLMQSPSAVTGEFAGEGVADDEVVEDKEVQGLSSHLINKQKSLGLHLFGEESKMDYETGAGGGPETAGTSMLSPQSMMSPGPGNHGGPVVRAAQRRMPPYPLSPDKVPLYYASLLQRHEENAQQQFAPNGFVGNNADDLDHEEGIPLTENVVEARKRFDSDDPTGRGFNYGPPSVSTLHTNTNIAIGTSSWDMDMHVQPQLDLTLNNPHQFESFAHALQQMTAPQVVAKCWELCSSRSDLAGPELMRLLNAYPGIPLNDIHDINMGTLLMKACSNGVIDVIKVLLTAGANAFATDNHGIGILHCAAAENHAHVLNYLLRESPHKLQVNCKSISGNTALQRAAEHGHVAAARVLLMNGAELNITDRDGFTALHFACLHSQHDMVVLLVQWDGCDLLILSKGGELPVDVAKTASIKRLLQCVMRLRKTDMSDIPARHRAQQAVDRATEALTRLGASESAAQMVNSSSGSTLHTHSNHNNNPSREHPQQHHTNGHANRNQNNRARRPLSAGSQSAVTSSTFSAAADGNLEDGYNHYRNIVRNQRLAQQQQIQEITFRNQVRKNSIDSEYVPRGVQPATIVLPVSNGESGQRTNNNKPKKVQRVTMSNIPTRKAPIPVFKKPKAASASTSSGASHHGFAADEFERPIPVEERAPSPVIRVIHSPHNSPKRSNSAGKDRHRDKLKSEEDLAWFDHSTLHGAAESPAMMASTTGGGGSGAKRSQDKNKHRNQSLTDVSNQQQEHPTVNSNGASVSKRSSFGMIADFLTFNRYSSRKSSAGLNDSQLTIDNSARYRQLAMSIDSFTRFAGSKEGQYRAFYRWKHNCGANADDSWYLEPQRSTRHGTLSSVGNELINQIILDENFSFEDEEELDHEMKAAALQDSILQSIGESDGKLRVSDSRVFQDLNDLHSTVHSHKLSADQYAATSLPVPNITTTAQAAAVDNGRDMDINMARLANDVASDSIEHEDHHFIHVVNDEAPLPLLQVTADFLQGKGEGKITSDKFATPSRPWTGTLETPAPISLLSPTGGSTNKRSVLRNQLLAAHMPDLAETFEQLDGIIKENEVLLWIFVKYFSSNKASIPSCACFCEARYLKLLLSRTDVWNLLKRFDVCPMHCSKLLLNEYISKILACARCSPSAVPFTAFRSGIPRTPRTIKPMLNFETPPVNEENPDAHCLGLLDFIKVLWLIAESSHAEKLKTGHAAQTPAQQFATMLEVMNTSSGRTFLTQEAGDTRKIPQFTFVAIGGLATSRASPRPTPSSKKLFFPKSPEGSPTGGDRITAAASSKPKLVDNAPSEEKDGDQSKFHNRSDSQPRPGTVRLRVTNLESGKSAAAASATTTSTTSSGRPPVSGDRDSREGGRPLSIRKPNLTITVPGSRGSSRSPSAERDGRSDHSSVNSSPRRIESRSSSPRRLGGSRNPSPMFSNSNSSPKVGVTAAVPSPKVVGSSSSSSSGVQSSMFTSTSHGTTKAPSNNRAPLPNPIVTIKYNTNDDVEL